MIGRVEETLHLSDAADVFLDAAARTALKCEQPGLTVPAREAAADAGEADEAR